MIVSAIACSDSTGPRKDDDPLTDTWELAADFTQYFHEGGPTGCGFYVEHCAVIDTVAGPTLDAVLTIFNGVTGQLTFRRCVSISPDGSCAAYGAAQTAVVPSGSVDTTSSQGSVTSVGLDMDVQLPSGLTWTAVHLRTVRLAGDSLSGSIIWEEYPSYQAVQPAYIGTFVAHRRR